MLFFIGATSWIVRMHARQQCVQLHFNPYVSNLDGFDPFVWSDVDLFGRLSAWHTVHHFHYARNQKEKLRCISTIKCIK